MANLTLGAVCVALLTCFVGWAPSGGSLVVAVPERDHAVLVADSATTTSQLVRGSQSACKLVVTARYAIGVTGVTRAGDGSLYDVVGALRSIATEEATVSGAVSRLLAEQGDAIRFMAVALNRRADALHLAVLGDAGDDGHSVEERQLLVTVVSVEMYDSAPRIETRRVFVTLPRSGQQAIERSRLLATRTQCDGLRCGAFVAIGHLSAVQQGFADAPRSARVSGGLPLATALLEAQAKATPNAVAPPFSAARVDAAGARWLTRHKPC